MQKWIIPFILLSIFACTPQAPLPITGEETASASSNDGNNSSSDQNATIEWYSSGTLSKIITLDVDNSKNIYLKGDDLESYLSVSTLFSKNYCMVIDFQASPGNTPKQLRLKVVPQKMTDFKTAQIITLMRVSTSSSSGNDVCNKSIEYFDSSINGYALINPPATLSYHTSSVCVGCLNMISSSSVKLYGIENSNLFPATQILRQVENINIDTSLLSFKINQNSSTTVETGSCTQSKCQSLGFDCCYNGQCVKEAATITSAITNDPTGFAAAELEKTLNPKWYLNYPQYYYACLNTVPQDETTPPVTPQYPQEDADARLTALKNDYLCINEIESNSLSSPFHTAPINGSHVYSYCNTATPSHNLYYQTVLTRLYQNCGCNENNLNEMVLSCPAYTYRPVYASDAVTIENIICHTLPSQTAPLPFQNLSVAVNSRNAPHRFFDTTNTEIDPTKALPSGATGIQEGTEFQYIDSSKLIASNGSFNMNSVLGQMSVSLNDARPATAISLEFDKVYYIAALSGYYTPCETCGGDSWFQNFSARPSSSQGIGLRSVGYSTSRSSWGHNLSLGNYEDTIFGRACFIPPTMIPFSHISGGTSSAQRQNRLNTQAALFINGYKRDWFGFNQGALIGSFDGVTWFAVGKGRIVRSTSTKLFLAINAPFADLATPTDHVVSVQEYDFITTGAVFDFDPNLAMNSPKQNEGGSCQINHECETDTDCITTLGWEYMCASVTDYKTNWPSFDPATANENANTTLTGTIVDFLQSKELPSGSVKRCAYRGAGAPCVANYTALSSDTLRKNLSCAPNFYCAGLNSKVYNKEVARFAASLPELLNSNNHLYGQDANVLGRPFYYLPNSTQAENLTNAIQSTLSTNIRLMAPSAALTVGICRPGKYLASNNPETQHRNADPSMRTDYISQIGSCNSINWTTSRHASCPVIDTDGDYAHLKQANYSSGTFLTSTHNTNASLQNACGLESIYNGTAYLGATQSTLHNLSPMKLIEALTLNTNGTILEPTLAADACLRRAGSVCHTDLDCFPNQMHADQIDLFATEYFGNLAEKNFYSERLVCGQKNSQPTPQNGTEYESFEMNKNRCCRPVGETLTMYTANTPNVAESTNLATRTPGSKNPSLATRYSRYAVDNSSVQVNASNSSVTTTNNQWNVIHNTAARTCCGQSWVRKFADGTNNWNKNRLNLDVNNFRCLNFNTPIVENNFPLTSLPWNTSLTGFGVTSASLSYDRARMCLDPETTASGCAAHKIYADDTTFDSYSAPVVDTTATQNFIITNANMMSSQFQDNPWAFYVPDDAYGDKISYLNWSLEKDDVKIHANIKIALPSWIPTTFNDGAHATDTQIFLTDNNGTEVQCAAAAATPNVQDNIAPAFGPTSKTTKHEFYAAGSCGANTECCFHYSSSTRIMTIAPIIAGGGSFDPDTYTFPSDDVAAKILFTAPGTQLFTGLYATVGRSSAPGNQNYYLQRLSRFEYVGIPQITYGALLCNTDSTKLVPGLFKTSSVGTTRTSFNAVAINDSGTNAIHEDLDGTATKKVVTQDKVAIEPIFDSSEFKCCLPLGSDTTDTSLCCSGFGVENDSSNTVGNGELPSYTCKLPAGVDLMVYLNKFVSGEGVDADDEDLTPLTVGDVGSALSDFDQRTGEPKSSDSVLQKIWAFGEKHCASGKVRAGGAFGEYRPEVGGKGPSATTDGTSYNIVDSVFDSGTHNDTIVGYVPFMEGHRWNHHLYCDYE